MRSGKFVCDECGKQKGDVNRWWMLETMTGVFWLIAWRKNEETNSQIKHLCGQECAHKALDKFLSEAVNASGGK